MSSISNRFITAIRGAFGRVTPLLAAWVVALLAMPIVQWAVGHPGLVAGVILGVMNSERRGVPPPTCGGEGPLPVHQLPVPAAGL